VPRPPLVSHARVTLLVREKRGRHKENDMTDISFISRYDRRVSFVQEVLAKNSALGDQAARELAVQVVYAIDHIPEPTR
jgi:hypothetical protein